MRVIAGHFRSRVLTAPHGSATRPTSDRLRETLFNVLGPRVVESRWADLYAGSGAVGIEALSRGAATCRFVERAAPALAALKKNVAALQLGPQVTIESRPVARVLQDPQCREPLFDFVFLDPPYESAEDYASTLGLLSRPNPAVLAQGGLVIAEHARRWPMPEQVGNLQRTRLLQQGDAALSFYTRDQAQADSAQATL